jgi:hypothetical protein
MAGKFRASESNFTKLPRSHPPYEPSRGGLPLSGIEILEKKLATVYDLHGARANFRSVVYANTAHEYLPEMQAAMVGWFEKHLGRNK